MPPWRPFVFLFDITISSHVFACAIDFATLFISLTLLSNRTAQKPYSLSPFYIGLCYIPTCIFSLLGSVFGGLVSDWSTKRFPHAAEGRLIFSLLGSLLCPIGLLLCGWTFHFSVHLAVPIMGASLFCFGETFLFASVAAFVNIEKPSMAGAILALITALSFVLAGVGIIVAIPLVAVIKYGPLFSILAALSLIITIVSIVVVGCQIRKTTFTVTVSDKSKTEPLSMKHTETTSNQRF
ncbi:hypothetical protein I4U23_015516 [Adineta vaga]|nr:hypothetical protein I4U23_015516 [Adineta vaga]